MGVVSSMGVEFDGGGQAPDAAGQGVVEVCVRMLGSVRFVAPGREPVLSEKQLQRIERAWILLEEGDDRAAEGLVRSVESELWAHDLVALARLRGVEGRFPPLPASRRPKRQKGRVPAAPDPTKALSKDDRKAMVDAEVSRAKAWLLSAIGVEGLAADELLAAKKTEHRIQQAQEAKAEQGWFDEVLAQIRELEAPRGGKIVEESNAAAKAVRVAVPDRGVAERLHDAGLLSKAQLTAIEAGHAVEEETAPKEESEGKRYRIDNRDALHQLFLAGDLTERLYRAGKAYRDLNKLIHRGLKSGLDFSVRGNGVSDPFAVQVQEAGDQLRAIEARVAATDRSGTGIMVLRAVVLEDRSIRSLAPNSGSRQKALSGALKRALAEVVGEITAPKGRAA